LLPRTDSGQKQHYSYATLVPLFALSLSVLICASVQAGEKQEHKDKIIEEPAAEKWELKIAVPSWIAASRGDVGLNGTTSHINIGFNEIVNKIDMAGSIRAEAGFGRFGILADFSYFSLSDSVGADGVVRKQDIREDEILGDLGLRWRLIDTPRGWLDVIGGVHYTYIYEELGLHSNDQAIRAAAIRLAIAGTRLRLGLARELRALSGNDAHFAIPPLGAGEAERLARIIGRIKGNTTERANAIDKLLRKELNRRLNRTDDWFDPYIGLRGRYNFSEKCYFIARADVSPFDIGSDFAWQASAGFGCQLKPRIYGELVYRILDIEYRHDGFIYDTTTHGPELTLGMIF
jgi:hypothetical protein